MKTNVNPIALIVAGIVLLLFILFLFNRTMTPSAPAYTLSAPGNDADGAAAKRANYLKAHGKSPDKGSAPASDTKL